MNDRRVSRANAYGRSRITPARIVVADAVDGFRGAFTVEELAGAVRFRHRTAGATATVYRAVAAMEKSGYLARVGARDGSALYARCDHAEHHHHIVCEACGRTAVADCPIDTSAPLAGGFVVTRHEVTLYGLCPECAAKVGG